MKCGMGFNVDILASSTVGKDGIVQVPTAFMEEYFNISRVTLTDWEKKGCPKLARGKWDFIAVLKWRGGLDATNDNPEDADKNLYAQKLKAEIFLKEQQGQLAEIELQKARGQVIEISEVEEVFGTVVSNAKTLFLSLPSKIAPKLLGLSVLEDLQDALAEHIPQLVKAKTTKEVQKQITDSISSLTEARSLVEINDIVSRLIHEILEELSSVDVSQLDGDDS